MNENSKKLFSATRHTLTADRKAALKERVFAAIAQTGPDVAPSPWVVIMRRMMRGYVLAPLVVILFVAGTAFASADSVPGDLLYPVKRRVEHVRVLAAPTEAAKLELQVDFAAERLKEAQKIQALTPLPHTTPTPTPRILLPADPTPTDATIVPTPTPTKALTRKQRDKAQIAEQEANSAVRFLEQTKEQLEKQGEQRKAEAIEQTLRNFRDRSDRRGDTKDNDDKEDRDHSSERPTPSEQTRTLFRQ